jgi:cephalosporin hydroxylase
MKTPTNGIGILAATLLAASLSACGMDAVYPGAPPSDAVKVGSNIRKVVLRAGTGSESPSPSVAVTYHALGWDNHGVLGVNTPERGQPSSHPLGRTPPGIRMALETMVVNEKARFWIPRALMDYSQPTRDPQLHVMEYELLAIEPLNQGAAFSAEQQKTVDDFNYLYANTHILARNITFMGIEIQQNPCDTWMMQEIVAELRPDLIIETGTYTGGQTLYLASLLEWANPAGKVITVDINPMVEKASKIPLFRKRVSVVKGSSTSPKVMKFLAEQVEAGMKVLVTLDSLHTKDHVLEELELYAPLVSKGSYLVVQDTNIRDFFPTFGAGPGEAVEEFLKTHPEFEVDESRERLLLTYYPGGYLRKVN